MKKNWAALTLIGILLSAGAVGGQEVFDIRRQVAANTDQLSLSRYTRLSDQRDKFGLTRHQWALWCQLGKKIGIDYCPPYKPGPQGG